MLRAPRSALSAGRCSPVSMSFTSMRVADDHDHARADPVRLLQLALHASGRPAPSRRAAPPRGARCASAKARRAASASATRDEDVGRRPVASSPRRREQHPLDARGPAHPGRRRAAELLDQAVVAAAAAERGLRAEALATRTRTPCACSSRARARASGRSRTSSPAVVEQRPHLGEVLRVLGAEPVEQARRVRHHRLGARVVGVERAQRVLRRAARAPRRELASRVAQVAAQLVAVVRARLRRAEARQPQPRRPVPRRARDLREQQDQLGVERRVVGAERLGADLGELAVAARLRRLVAEERARGTRASPAAAACACRARRRRGRSPAVPSGRSVSERPALSSNVNISFWTMSVDSPTPRANSSVSSNTGVSIGS